MGPSKSFTFGCSVSNRYIRLFKSIKLLGAPFRVHQETSFGKAFLKLSGAPFQSWFHQESFCNRNQSFRGFLLKHGSIREKFLESTYSKLLGVPLKTWVHHGKAFPIFWGIP